MGISPLHIPDWLLWTAAKGSLIAAWVGLILATRRELLERVRLRFKFHATFIEEDDANADVRQEVDGAPLADAMLMTVTNKGRGITIGQCRCDYETSSGSGARTSATVADVGEYIGQGKACDARLKVYFRPTKFTSAVAVDSTGKSWRCSRRELKQLNSESEQWWDKKPFQKHASSTDKTLAERRREKQHERLQAESVAAQEAGKIRERQAEQRRKLYSLMRRIDCIECAFQFPPSPTGAVFNVTVIRQINHGIESIQDALMELADLPETKTVLGVTIPCPTQTNAPWDELHDVYDRHFLPIQKVFRDLKIEVLGASMPAVG
jgi:hypothetical protein